MEKAIVITGFMGTGKTTVGKLVAEKLERRFVDLDGLTTELAGRSIPDLFAEGEEQFRWWEQLAFSKLDLDQPIVLATGGGTLVGNWNRRQLGGVPVFVLDAAFEQVQARVGREGERPLAQQLTRLYERRAAAYDRLPFHIRTDHKAPAQVAEEVLALLDRTPPAPPASDGETITVQPPGDATYPIHIEKGIAAGIGGMVDRLAPGAVALITDDHIGRLWGETVRHDLLAARLPTGLIEIPSGEDQKHLETVATLYDRLLDAGIDRSGVVVALGGGVIGDMAGFVAATWMRGVRGFVQVPTSLLAMVDASIGGKTGVDHPRGKNLIGAFRQPDLVLIDPSFLQTLPTRELRAGLAEVIKHGILADPHLFDQIERGDDLSPDALRETLTPSLLARAVRVKAAIVERDPLERGERAKLNLGHTFGHAYELLSGFHLAHGEAVAVGIVTAARLSERLGIAEAGLARRIESLLSRAGLPTRWRGGADAGRVWQAMQSDKKRAGKGLRLILPRAIGDVIITEPGEVSRETVCQVIEEQNR